MHEAPFEQAYFEGGMKQKKSPAYSVALLEQHERVSLIGGSHKYDPKGVKSQMRMLFFHIEARIAFSAASPSMH